ncbi:MAG: HAMP domain-containing sensor histidine kinase [Candidatus Omnitrophota bacterium]
MKTRIVLIFLVAILIPTALLAYFGLLAVRSEQTIIERNMRERHEFMADIVLGEIEVRLKEMPPDLAKNKKYLESVLAGEAAIFKGQAAVFTPDKRAIGGPLKSFAFTGEEKPEAPALMRPIPKTDYSLAIYERYPLPLIKKQEEQMRGLHFYIAIIIFSAISILVGGFFTLWALSREWRLAKLKSEFVSGLSHDLRRPLTSIRMFSEMLREDRVPKTEKKQEYYDIINSESERLTHLANNILDFSRIETGRKRFNFEAENIANVVTDTVERFRKYMADEGRKIKLSIEGEIPPVKIDVSAMAQAFMNLISNAAKFSDPDQEIVVNLKRDGKSNIVIEIRDSGIGIPKADIKKIFNRFYRTSQKRVRDIEGSGMGLALVKYTIEAHKGRVVVESEEGKGSTFSVILPCIRT